MALSKTAVGTKGKVPNICAFVVSKFPIRNVWGYASTPDHNTRECVDYMTVQTGRSPADVKKVGDQIAAWHIAQHEAGNIKIKFMVWRGRAWRPVANSAGPKGWGPYRYPATHYDHVHVQYDSNVWKAPDAPAYLGPFWVDPKKVSTTLTANAPKGKNDLQRKPGFKISTGVKVDGKWLVTEKGYRYHMDYLTRVNPNV